VFDSDGWYKFHYNNTAVHGAETRNERMTTVLAFLWVVVALLVGAAIAAYGFGANSLRVVAMFLPIAVVAALAVTAIARRTNRPRLARNVPNN
jgi:Na+-translocating ferredoxin:NAD+ oxidoreductase RnfD subunit